MLKRIGKYSIAISIMAVASHSNADALPCTEGWQVFAQQSEGYQLNSTCDTKAVGKFVLEPFGRIVLTKEVDAKSVELVCDNNGEGNVGLTLMDTPQTLSLKGASDDCSWGEGLYTCSGKLANSLFCSNTTRVAVADSGSPVLTASASWRSSPFTFSYKQEIIAGVEIISPKIASCKRQSNIKIGLPASWYIDASGRIQDLKLGAEHESLAKCVNKVMSDYRFPEHGFAKQYWRQVFF